MRILIVEDDKYIAEALAATLTDQHFTVDIVTDGQTGWEQAQIFDYDLILLDVMLPKLDGLTLCRKLRSIKENTPILLLTARDRSEDKVKGLDAGADDYLVKPVDFQELSARIRALLRRGSESLGPIVTWGDLSLNPSTCEVNYAGNLLNLTPKEYGILKLFMHNSQRVFSCRAILDKLWSFEDMPTEDTVRAHIKGLRQKLKAAGAPKDFIETVYGLGYRLNAQSEPGEFDKNSAIRLEEKKDKLAAKNGKKKRVKESSKNGVKNPDLVDNSSRCNNCQLSESPISNSAITNSAITNSPITNSPVESLQGAMAKIWDRFQGGLSDRLTVLDLAVAEVEKGEIQKELREQAQQEAHKLAGSLGTFGLASGSKIAREIELLFEAEISINQEQIFHLSELIEALKFELDKKKETENFATIQEFLTNDLTSASSVEFVSHEGKDGLMHGVRPTLASSVVGAQSISERKDEGLVRVAHPTVPSASAVGAESMSEGKDGGLVRGAHPTLASASGVAVRRAPKEGDKGFVGGTESLALASGVGARCAPYKGDEGDEESALLLIVSDDALLKQGLVAEAKKWGMRVQVASEISAVLRGLGSVDRSDFDIYPKVVLLDLDIDESYPHLLTELARQIPSILIVVLTDRSDLDFRVKVANLGVGVCLQKPVTSDRAMEVIGDLLQQTDAQPTVMIVDDDREILEALQILLEAKGITTFVLNDERQFWETLENTAPDLLVLDVEMPHFNGIELCRVLRNDPRWSRLPVLFLTAHTHAVIRHQVFVAGADDYLNKPFIPSELVTRIFNRINRSQAFIDRVEPQKVIIR